MKDFKQDNSILDAFDMVVKTGTDTTAIRDKYLSLVANLIKFYETIDMLAVINKTHPEQRNLRIFAGYAKSEVEKHVWRADYDLIFLMRNLRNEAVVGDCKQSLGRLMDSPWTEYAVYFISLVKEQLPHLFTEEQVKHRRELTVIKRTVAERVAVASKIFCRPEVRLIMSPSARFDDATEIDLAQELSALRNIDWQQLLLPMDHGQLQTAVANSNFISFTNMLIHANEVVNDIYTPDINPDIIRDFTEKGLSHICEGAGTQHLRARRFVDQRTEMFQANFYRYYREYVNTGDMSSFLVEFLKDIEEAASHSTDIGSDLASFQRMVLNKVAKSPAYGSHPAVAAITKKLNKRTVISETNDKLRNIRSGDASGSKK